MKTVFAITFLFGVVACIYNGGNESLVPEVIKVEETVDDLTENIRDLFEQVIKVIDNAEEDLDGDIRSFLLKVKDALSNAPADQQGVVQALTAIENLAENAGKDIVATANATAKQINQVTQDTVQKIDESAKELVSSVKETLEKARKGLEG